MHKAKILAVAPYEGMADVISSVAQSRDDVEITVQTGDLDTGKNIALELAHKNYDVILSRGGTAELIRSNVELPVIEIPISVYDVLRTIKLAENYSGKFIITGFPAITSCARTLCDLLQYDIDIMTFTDKSDVLPLLRKAQLGGCTLVLSDMIGTKAATELGMNSILIPSGVESITSAINEAAKFVHASTHVHKQKDLFQALLTDGDREFLIYNPAGGLWFSSIPATENNTSILNLAQTYLKAFMKVPDQTISRQIRDKVYILRNRHLLYDDQKYIAITIDRRDAILDEEDLGITIYNQQDQTENESAYDYSGAHTLGHIGDLIAEYARSTAPVLIVGEPGTGKDKVARLLYESGPYSTAPLYTIHCGLMRDRKWNNLMNSAASPLTTAGATIYLKDMGALSDTQQEELFSYIENSGLTKRNRLICSLITDPESAQASRQCRSTLENRFCCLTLQLSSLRERIEDLPSIAALYIHRMNVSTGKQVIGFEAEAMDLMRSFSWPNNLDQLHHVIKELITITRTAYITYENTQLMLAQEPGTTSSGPISGLDLSGTLDEINERIIYQVLEEENGSKERTARRLGISRSTLWRVLKK